MENCSTVPPSPTCPPDKPPVKCFVDPCQFAKCPAHPNAKCVSDFCGGCNARFFEDDEEVTDTCGKLHIAHLAAAQQCCIGCITIILLRLSGKGSGV